MKHINQKGQTLIMLLIFVIMCIMITTASVAMIVTNSQASDKLYQGTTALDVAESGAETAMIKLLRDPNYAGESVTVGTGQAVITVTGSNPKIIVSKGTIGNFTRKIQVVADYTNNILTASSWKEIQ
jgi:hypothetical protein